MFYDVFWFCLLQCCADDWVRHAETKSQLQVGVCPMKTVFSLRIEVTVLLVSTKPNSGLQGLVASCVSLGLQLVYSGVCL